MRKRELHIRDIRLAMDRQGLTQTTVARKLSVSKEAVSQWLSEKSFPNPRNLMRLGVLLDLDLKDLVADDDPDAPRVAFRKKRGAVTKDHHIQKAKFIGCFLRNLVPYLPFDALRMPPVLKDPSCDYGYLRTVAADVRRELDVAPEEDIDFHHLLGRFRDLQAVVVPVLWGSRKNHENAMHIYLPDSKSTWVYLNLDVNVHDFKFWMAHELGHCMSPALEGDAAEDFADAFAAALLYPHEAAAQAYDFVAAARTAAGRIGKVLELADERTISPYTVIKQINRYAAAAGRPEVELGQAFGGAVTNFNKGYQNVSQALFRDADTDAGGHPSARDYIRTAEENLGSIFFGLLREYIRNSGKSASVVQTALDMTLLDARNVHAELA